MGVPVSGKNLFPSNIAGLPTWYTIRASKDGYVARKRDSEVLVALNPETAKQDMLALPPGGVAIYEENLNLKQYRDDVVFYPVPFDKITAAICPEAKLRKLVKNMVYVGVVAQLLTSISRLLKRACASSSPRSRRSSTANGETRAWNLPKDFVCWPDDWFPDGTHLLVTRREGPSRTLSLWKLSLLGGNPEKIMDDAAGGSVSPDGSRIAYVPGPKFGSELWIMDSDGANSRRVARARKPDQTNLGDGWIQHAAWSPNGTRLAYVEAHLATPDPPLFANSLLTRDANGGDLQVVLQDDSRLRPALWWNADGRILFAYLDDSTSEREDTGIDSIAINERTGKATVPQQQVTEGQAGGLVV